MLKWLSRIASAAVEAVTEFIDDVLNAVGEFIADIFETLGNGLGDFFNLLDSLLPGSTASIFTWLGNIVASLFAFAGAAIKAVFDIAGNLISGVLRVLLGIVLLNPSLILEGFQDFTEIGGDLIVVLGKVWEMVQAVVIPTQRRRRLTPAEAAMLERIYHGSLALYNIRIIEGHTGLFGVNNTPFVLGNTIYLKGENVDPADPNANDHVLVHESMHVWQYQVEGGSYLTNALGASQPSNRLHGWRWELEAQERFRFRDFNKEAQGWFLEDVYRFGERLPGTPPAIDDGVFFDADETTTFGQFIGSFPHALLPNVTRDYTELARNAVDYIRGKINVRPSRLLQ